MRYESYNYFLRLLLINLYWPDYTASKTWFYNYTVHTHLFNYIKIKYIDWIKLCTYFSILNLYIYNFKTDFVFIIIDNIMLYTYLPTIYKQTLLMYPARDFTWHKWNIILYYYIYDIYKVMIMMGKANGPYRVPRIQKEPGLKQFFFYIVEIT